LVIRIWTSSLFCRLDQVSKLIEKVRGIVWAGAASDDIGTLRSAIFVAHSSSSVIQLMCVISTLREASPHLQQIRDFAQ